MKSKVEVKQSDIYGEGLADYLVDCMRYPIKHGFGLKWYQKLWRWIKRLLSKLK